jgi:hypothetical protein
MDKNRKLHFTEKNGLSKNELLCKTIYAYYDQPLIYILHNDNDRFFTYCFDVDTEKTTYFYIPITLKEQQSIEDKSICLRTILSKNNSYIINHYHENDKMKISNLDISMIKEKSLPKLGLYMEKEQI